MGQLRQNILFRVAVHVNDVELLQEGRLASLHVAEQQNLDRIVLGGLAPLLATRLLRSHLPNND